MKNLLIIILLLSVQVFSQEYEIAWKKEFGGTSEVFSTDGEFLYIVGGNSISEFRSSDGSFISTFDNSGYQYESGLSISPSNRYLSLNTRNGGSDIWDTESEKKVKTYNKFVDISFLNDSVFICRGSGTDDVIYKYNNNNGSEIQHRFCWPDDLYILKLSHNGKMFATASISGSKCYLTLWDIETLTEIKRFELEGNDGTTFISIKFSYDDSFVGVNTIYPYHAQIFDTQNLVFYFNTKNISPLGIGSFDFTSNNNYIVFNYNEFTKQDYNVFFVDRVTLKLNQNLRTISSSITSSSNGLIFTKYSLLKPKTVGVTENEQKRLLISPNPASDYIEINVGAGSKPALENPGIEIYNIFGEKNPTLALPVGEGTGKVLPNGEDLGGVFKIDVSNLAPGVYFIKIGDKFEKFVKI